MNLLQELGAIDFMLLMTAGLIALIAGFSKYRLIPAVLFAELCIFVGAETYMSIVCCVNVEEMVNYHYTQSSIVLFFFILYVNVFKSFWQSIFAFLSVIYLASLAILTNYGFIAIPIQAGIESYVIDVYLVGLYVIRLFIGLIEVLNGYGLLNDYRDMSHRIWHNIAHRNTGKRR